MWKNNFIFWTFHKEIFWIHFCDLFNRPVFKKKYGKNMRFAFGKQTNRWTDKQANRKTNQQTNKQNYYIYILGWYVKQTFSSSPKGQKKTFAETATTKAKATKTGRKFTKKKDRPWKIQKFPGKPHGYGYFR